MVITVTFQDEWNARLKSPVFQKIDMNVFFYEVERKFQREKRGSAIDIDLFANAAKGETQMDQLEELLHQFRRTPQTVLTFPSTTHAVVRTFIEEDRTDNLMRMLDDRLNYGLFPDDYCLVLMLDHFLEKSNWRDAAKVAVFMMLQENIEVPIAEHMGVLGAYKYAMEGLPEPWDPQADPPEPEPEDDVKVRVDYLDSGYFDDHFDLSKKEHLIGKTLAKFNAKLKEGDRLVQSLELLGLALFQKWDKFALALENDDTIVMDIKTKLEEIVAAEEELENKDALLTSLNAKSALDLDVEKELQDRINKSVNEFEPSYIEETIKDFKIWHERRQVELERQYKLYQTEARKLAVQQKKKELEQTEERLFFFERQEEYNKKKEDKVKEWAKKLPPRTWSGRITLKKKVTSTDEYIPPDVVSRKRTE